MARQKVFISYAYKDGYIVPLIAKLLEVHNIEPWYAESHLRGGDLFAEKIDGQLAGSDMLLVMVSEHARASKWITAEIVTFTTVNPDAPVIPVRLQRIDLDDVSPGLSKYQAVDMNADLLAGFRDLFAALGCDFLSKKELGSRRSGADRRQGEDRRVASVDLRIAMGLLVAYTRHCGKSVDNNTSLNPGDITMLRGAANEELSRYVYRDSRTGNEVPVPVVVDDAFDYARKFTKSQGGLSAVAVLGVIGRHVCESYDVAMKDRRNANRRPNDSPARKK